MKFLIHLLYTAALMLACGGLDNCSAIHSDGSAACGEPVWATDLIGTWADTSQGLSLTIDEYQRYTWHASYCHETGRVTGAVEFIPAENQASCYGYHELYSASVDWTDRGIRLFVDGVTEPINLAFQP